MAAEEADETLEVIAQCDRCGMTVVWINPDYNRRCIRHNIKTGVQCSGYVRDVVPGQKLLPYQHYSTIKPDQPHAT